jgi:diaminopimelate decarboxylase
VVADDVDLPADVRAGDLIGVAGSGAYHHAMACNYHLVPRPALVAVANGRPRLLIRRETIAEMLSRDIGD